ncbi:collagen alpha-1(I) chain-like [Schistocerca gregaria]|uniref:collagen alpha-1(I) chain-like n=1 Tax=Schistocerca gregaria TaxID=7010 RepID=UPI00211E3237|nr:collagen alpha-1(I) chain-like [Schistocerca gregaria]
MPMRADNGAHVRASRLGRAEAGRCPVCGACPTPHRRERVRLSQPAGSHRGRPMAGLRGLPRSPQDDARGSGPAGWVVPGLAAVRSVWPAPLPRERCARFRAEPSDWVAPGRPLSGLWGLPRSPHDRECASEPAGWVAPGTEGACPSQPAGSRRGRPLAGLWGLPHSPQDGARVSEPAGWVAPGRPLAGLWGLPRSPQDGARVSEPASWVAPGPATCRSVGPAPLPTGRSARVRASRLGSAGTGRWPVCGACPAPQETESANPIQPAGSRWGRPLYGLWGLPRSPQDGARVSEPAGWVAPGPNTCRSVGPAPLPTGRSARVRASRMGSARAGRWPVCGACPAPHRTERASEPAVCVARGLAACRSVGPAPLPKGRSARVRASRLACAGAGRCLVCGACHAPHRTECAHPSQLAVSRWGRPLSGLWGLPRYPHDGARVSEPAGWVMPGPAAGRSVGPTPLPTGQSAHVRPSRLCCAGAGRCPVCGAYPAPHKTQRARPNQPAGSRRGRPIACLWGLPRSPQDGVRASEPAGWVAPGPAAGRSVGPAPLPTGGSTCVRASRQCRTGAGQCTVCGACPAPTGRSALVRASQLGRAGASHLPVCGACPAPHRTERACPSQPAGSRRGRPLAGLWGLPRSPQDGAHVSEPASWVAPGPATCRSVGPAPLPTGRSTRVRASRMGSAGAGRCPVSVAYPAPHRTERVRPSQPAGSCRGRPLSGLWGLPSSPQDGARVSEPAGWVALGQAACRSVGPVPLPTGRSTRVRACRLGCAWAGRSPVCGACPAPQETESARPSQPAGLRRGRPLAGLWDLPRSPQDGARAAEPAGWVAPGPAAVRSVGHAPLPTGRSARYRAGRLGRVGAGRLPVCGACPAPYRTERPRPSQPAGLRRGRPLTGLWGLPRSPQDGARASKSAGWVALGPAAVRSVGPAPLPKRGSKRVRASRVCRAGAGRCPVCGACPSPQDTKHTCPSQPAGSRQCRQLSGLWFLPAPHRTARARPSQPDGLRRVRLLPGLWGLPRSPQDGARASEPAGWVAPGPAICQSVGPAPLSTGRSTRPSQLAVSRWGRPLAGLWGLPRSPQVGAHVSKPADWVAPGPATCRSVGPVPLPT